METAVTDNTHPMISDVIDQLLGLQQGMPLWEFRHARDKVVAATQLSYEGYFANNLSQLNLAQRFKIALVCSELTPCPTLSKHYAQQCDFNENQAGSTGVDQASMAAATEFARVLTTKPIDGDKALLQTLPKAGFDSPTIIALAQLVAFISFQTRVVQGLLAMQDVMQDDGVRNPVQAPHANMELFQNSKSAKKSNPNLPLGSVIRFKEFTNEVLDWTSWLDVLDIEKASAEQLAVLKESHPKATISDYYLTLIHQPEILKQRSIAFNAIMYATGGLSRADRELGATVVSRINGCVYCASVHAQRFEQLGKRNDVIQQVFENPYSVTTNPRDKAIADFSIQLTLEPQNINASNIAALMTVGMNHGEVLDLIYSIAMFAWANRLMLNLGEPTKATS
jgi:uncharacterized peroxidase-related enzyme